MAREPVVAGMFYEDDPEKLREQVKRYLDKAEAKKARAAITPHAGHPFSGECAAYSYKAVKDYKKIIILAPNHTGMGDNSVLMEDMKTPLGIVETDKELGKKIIERTGFSSSGAAHAREHSVEVHLPFLQTLGDYKIVPIVIGMADHHKLGNTLKEVMDEDTAIIASSDFTHYGQNFDYVPFTENIKENIEKLDKEAFESIKKGQEEFASLLKKTGATICGALPIMVTLEALGEYEAELMKHYSSADITGDYSHVVDYMAIALR
ncbi:MAG: AmmeMemoRadiSam system protein B [Nanobdellota archaeon]